MKLGIVSAIFDQSNFEEMIDIVAENGLDCVEVACWPKGKVERRYSGVSHIDTKNLTSEKALKFPLLPTIQIHSMKIWKKGKK